jgi:hypothetical protein
MSKFKGNRMKPLLPEKPKVLGADGQVAPQKPFRIAVAIPARDEVKTGFAMDLATMMAFTSVFGVAQGQFEVVLLTQKGTLIASQRHGLVVEAVRNGCDGILWLDADMRFPKDTIFRLLSHDKPIVGANYSTRASEPYHPVAFRGMDDENPMGYEYVYTREDSTGLEAIDSIGFGVIYTHIDVFLGMHPPAFQIQWQPKHGGYEGEDVYFCKKAREQGHEIFVDHDLSKQVRHIGEKEFGFENPLVFEEDALKELHGRRDRWLKQYEQMKKAVAPPPGEPDGLDDPK